MEFRSVRLSVVMGMLIMEFCDETKDMIFGVHYV